VYRNLCAEAEKASGGVGYERLIVTAELVQTIDTKKFIPIVRDNPSATKTPNFLGPRLYIDFSDDLAYATRCQELVREIHGNPSSSKPPIGENPFAGAAPAIAEPARVAGPSGITSSGKRILEEAWFEERRTTASMGLKKLGLTGAMELRFALHDPVNKAQIELLNAVRHAEIQTFGWPIGVLLENVDEYRPKPVADGIRAEISIPDGRAVRSVLVRFLGA